MLLEIEAVKYACSPRSLNPYKKLTAVSTKRLLASLIANMEDAEDVIHSQFADLTWDKRLLPLIGADDANYEILLVDLLTNHAMPLIKTIIGSKLKVYSGQGFSQGENVEVDDLCHEAVSNLIIYLGRIRLGQAEKPVRVLEDFVAKTAFNVFNNYLRQKYPQRHRLKRRVEYLVKTREDFDSWKENNQKLIGYAYWQGGARSQGQSERLADLRRDEQAFVAARMDGQPIEELSLRWLLENLLDWIGQPMEVDSLVDVIARILKIVDSPGEAPVAKIEDIGENDSTPLQLEQREYLKKVWGEILFLPDRQRKALLLNLKNDDVGVIDILPVCQIASPLEIAKALEISMEELAELWDRLPLPDAQIGIMLAIDPQKVANLRKTARERLERKMKKLLKQ